MHCHLPPPSGLSRRETLAAALGLLAAGCADSLKIPVLANFPDAMRFAVLGQPDIPLKRDDVTKLPYASITAKIGKGPRSLLVLGRYDGDDLHYLSADRVAVVTRKGRLVKTAGLPQNLKNTQTSVGDPVAGRLHELTESARFVRTVDIDPGSYYGMPIVSVFEPLGPVTLTILEIEFDTVLVRERNTAKTMRWSYDNYYWVDAYDGFVWKSVQHIVRAFPPIEIEVLKPAA